MRGQESFIGLLTVLALALGAPAMAGMTCGNALDAEQPELNRRAVGASVLIDGCPYDVTASDSLGILRASVGSIECSECVCDVDSSGRVTATDSLIALYCSIGIEVPTMGCRPCG